MAAPVETQLATAVDGVTFPYWEDRFAWRSTGARTDRLDGRTVTTVFYANRDGRMCVLSGKGVSGATLLALAGWSDDHPTPA
jgi:hypothetical protein